MQLINMQQRTKCHWWTFLNLHHRLQGTWPRVLHFFLSYFFPVTIIVYHQANWCHIYNIIFWIFWQIISSSKRLISIVSSAETISQSWGLSVWWLRHSQPPPYVVECACIVSVCVVLCNSKKKSLDTASWLRSHIWIWLVHVMYRCSMHTWI
jgi:hypothetical protein